jgi:bifunctional non-homologous end joining protein LigD
VVTRHRLPPVIEPMLASPDRGRLPDSADFAYEYKYDGYRAITRVAPDGTMAVTSRNGNDLTDEFAVLAGGLGDALGGRAAVLDGELVVLNEAGQPEFGLMQERRGRFQQGYSVAAESVLYVVFDLLQLGDRRLLAEPYDRRRALLEQLELPEPERIVVGPSFTHTMLTQLGLTPEDLLERSAAAGYEGLVAKRRASRYYPGQRSLEWRKHPLIHTQEVVVCGWRAGKGRREGTLGSLLLGAHDPVTGDLLYVGDVGTGFTDRALRELQARLDRLARPRWPFAAEPPREDARHAHWVEPELVGEVVYRQFTRTDHRLRHAAWRGLRADRSPTECVVPQPTLAPAPDAAVETQDAPAQRVTVQVDNRRLVLSNLDKELYPADGFTKGEVINYYSRICPVLLPHISGRPVTFVRFPDGVDGEPFFEKNVPRHAPDWVRTVRLPSSGSRGRGDHIDYVLVEDLPTLVWAANLAALELHVPQWTVGGLPDRLVFDLDPGPGATVVECCRVAERLHDRLVADGLTPYAKTSGAKGMQLYAAIVVTDAGRPSAYAKALAGQLAAETPDLVVAKMAKNLRRGKVFIDWSQNNPAKTTIAPYSLRGRPRPTASTPVTWEEVRACRAPGELVFTAPDVLDRVERLGDLLALGDGRPIP